VMVGRTAQFLVAVVMAGQCGPGGGDGQTDGIVTGSSDDGDGGGGGRGGNGLVPGSALKVEEEQGDDDGERGGAGR
jgi:hypothetical protein